MTHDHKEDAEIVSLTRYKSTLQHSALAQVEAYWLALRNGRVVPSRSDVDPRGIDRALEFAFILERIAPGMARFRLAGMHLNDLMGMEVRGMPLTSFFVPDARRQVSDALEHVFEQPAISRFDLSADRGIGKPQLDAALLILPLKSDLGDVSRALGCLVSTGEIGRTPRRFSVTDMRVDPLIAGVDPAAGTPRPATEPATTPVTPAPEAQSPVERIPGLSEHQRPFASKPIAEDKDGRPGKATHVPWLRVVSTDTDD